MARWWILGNQMNSNVFPLPTVIKVHTFGGYCCVMSGKKFLTLREVMNPTLTDKHTKYLPLYVTTAVEYSM